MKKILSVILTIITILSVLAVPGVSASAKAKETTYNAQSSVYHCSKGTVVNEGRCITYYPKSGTGINLVTLSVGGEEGLIKFYVRGNYLYYTDNNFYLYRIRLDGNNREFLLKCHDEEMVGAYGNKIIFKSYSYDLDTKKVKEFPYIFFNDFFNDSSVLFNGKLYTEDYKYNISKGKIEKSAYKDTLVNTSKYLYYVNSNNNLVRLDTNGKKVKLEKDIESVNGTNGANTVLFVKNDNLYRKTKTQKSVLVLSKKNMVKNYFAKIENYSKKALAKVKISKYDVSYNKCALSEGIIGVACSIYGGNTYDTFVLRTDLNGKGFKTVINGYDDMKVHSVGVYKGKVHCMAEDHENNLYYV